MILILLFVVVQSVDTVCMRLGETEAEEQPAAITQKELATEILVNIFQQVEPKTMGTLFFVSPRFSKIATYVVQKRFDKFVGYGREISEEALWEMNDMRAVSKKWNQKILEHFDNTFQLRERYEVLPWGTIEQTYPNDLAIELQNAHNSYHRMKNGPYVMHFVKALDPRQSSRFMDTKFVTTRDYVRIRLQDKSDTSSPREFYWALRQGHIDSESLPWLKLPTTPEYFNHVERHLLPKFPTVFPWAEIDQSKINLWVFKEYLDRTIFYDTHSVVALLGGSAVYAPSRPWTADVKKRMAMGVFFLRPLRAEVRKMVHTMLDWDNIKKSYQQGTDVLVKKQRMRLGSVYMGPYRYPYLKKEHQKGISDKYFQDSPASHASDVPK